MQGVGALNHNLTLYLNFNREAAEIKRTITSKIKT